MRSGLNIGGGINIDLRIGDGRNEDRTRCGGNGSHVAKRRRVGGIEVQDAAAGADRRAARNRVRHGRGNIDDDGRANWRRLASALAITGSSASSEPVAVDIETLPEPVMLAWPLMATVAVEPCRDVAAVEAKE